MQRVAPSVTARQQPHVIDDYGKDPAPPHPRTPALRDVVPRALGALQEAETA